MFPTKQYHIDRDALYGQDWVSWFGYLKMVMHGLSQVGIGQGCSNPKFELFESWFAFCSSCKPYRCTHVHIYWKMFPH
jgi:hypothetical protein